MSSEYRTAHRVISSTLISAHAEYHDTEHGYYVPGTIARDDVEIDVAPHGASQLISNRHGSIGTVTCPAVAARLAVAMSRAAAAPRISR